MLQKQKRANQSAFRSNFRFQHQAAIPGQKSVIPSNAIRKITMSIAKKRSTAQTMDKMMCSTISQIFGIQFTVATLFARVIWFMQLITISTCVPFDHLSIALCVCVRRIKKSMKKWTEINQSINSNLHCTRQTMAPYIQFRFVIHTHTYDCKHNCKQMRAIDHNFECPFQDCRFVERPYHQHNRNHNKWTGNEV